MASTELSGYKICHNPRKAAQKAGMNPNIPCSEKTAGPQYRSRTVRLRRQRIPAKENTEALALKRVELMDCLKELQKLPEQMREVMYLRAMSDLSYREIGEIMGKSENWARVTFYRAKEQLLKGRDRDE